MQECPTSSALPLHERRQPRPRRPLFHRHLGFTTYINRNGYAYLQRETAGFRILEQRGHEAAHPGTRRYAYYIDGKDVDQLYAELKPKLDTLPSGDVRGPINREYASVSF